jgi:hypothetical protein
MRGEPCFPVALESGEKKGMLMHIDLDQPSAKGNEVRTAVRDNRTGNIGTLAVPSVPVE